MGKSAGAAKTQVTDYRLSIHLGIATVVDELTGIYVDQKPLWEGASAGGIDTFHINMPNLYGGPTTGGGCVGTITYLPGLDDQVMLEALAQRMGRTADTCPAYRGLSSLFFTGETQPGFNWTSNNPVVAQNVSAKVKRAPKGLNPDKALLTTDITVITVTHTDTGSDGKSTTTTTTYVDGTDPGIGTYTGDTVTTGTRTITSANPAHIIYETLTNGDWGMGASIAAIDTDAFETCADVLFTEGLGLSVLWSQQSTVEDFINEIISHIQGVLFLDPMTGLISMKLIRADYDVDNLPVYDPDSAQMSNLQRRLWGETINEIVVTWTNPLSEKGESVVLQDQANIAIQGGIVSDSRNYYGARTADLASKLAARDLRAVSAPLRSMEMQVDRSAWAARPGDVILVNWPEKRIEGAVMRVGKVDYGKAGDPAVKVSLLEDVFSLEHPHVTQAPSSHWTDPSKVPEPIDQSAIITLPAFFTSTADLQAAAVDLTYPEVLAAVFGYTADRETTGFDLVTQAADATGTIGYTGIGTKTITEHSILPSGGIAAETITILPQAMILHTDRGPSVGDFAFIGASDSDFEIALVTAVSNTTITLSRGVLDTVPTARAAGTAVWWVKVGERIVDDKYPRSAGEEVDYKLLTRTSLGVLHLADAPVVSTTLTARPYLPLRPANVKVNGVAFAPVAAGSTLGITWATRNRTLEDGQVVAWTDGPISPEYKQETVVTVTNGGSIVYRQRGLWTENELDLPAAYFARWTDVYVTVQSKIDDLWSLQGFTIHVTGLAGNPGAPPPPDPPPVTDPPSPLPAPAQSAWSVTGTAVEDPSGTAIPVIQIEGVQDNPDAIGLIARFRKDSSQDWTVHPLIKLSGLPITANISGVASKTAYDVDLAYEVAYGAGNGTILTKWRSYGPVTTGELVSGNTKKVGDQEVADLIAQLAAAYAKAQSAIDTANSAVVAIGYGPDTNALALIEKSISSTDIAIVQDALGRSPTTGEVINKVIDEHTDVLADHTVKFAAIIRKNAAGTGYVFDFADVAVDDAGTTLVQKVTSISSTTAGGIVAAATQYLVTLTDVNHALSTSGTTLNSTFGSLFVTASAYHQLTTLTDVNQAISTEGTTLHSTFHNAIASAVTGLVTLADVSGALAESGTDLNTAVGNLIGSATEHMVTSTTAGQTLEGYDLDLKAGFKTDGTAAAGTIGAEVHVQGGALTTVEGKTVAFLQQEASAGAGAALVRIMADDVSTAVQLIAQGVFFGSKMEADEETSTFRWFSGTVQLVIGMGFGASGNLLLWAGSASTAVSSMTTGNAGVYIDTSAHLGGPGVPTGSGSGSGTVGNTNAGNFHVPGAGGEVGNVSASGASGTGYYACTGDIFYVTRQCSGGYALYVNGNQVSSGSFATGENNGGHYSVNTTSGNGFAGLGRTTPSGSISASMQINASDGQAVDGAFDLTISFTPQ